MQLAISSTSSDMTISFHARPDDKFIDLKCNLKKKRNFVEQNSFSNRDNIKIQLQFTGKNSDNNFII